jgi:hypothetical protein
MERQTIKLKKMDSPAPEVMKTFGAFDTTEAEIAEAAMVAASLRAGTTVTHATHALLG